MKVIVSLTGTTRHREVAWPDGWPVPRAGDLVTLYPDIPEVTHVRTVVWFPEGDAENAEPVVYLVLGPRRGLS